MISGLWEYLKGVYRGWRGLPAEELGVIGVAEYATVPPPPPVPDLIKRFPKYPLGCRLKIREHVGIVDAIFADIRAAQNCNLIGFNWIDQQIHPPSSTDQVFYSIITIKGGPDGSEYIAGSILAGENDVELVEGQR